MNLNPSFDEVQWVIQITRALDNEVELEEDDGIPVTIFNIPKALLSNKSECYTPQLIGLGPYHRWHPELYQMEKYKISAAKRIQNQLHGLRFENLVVDHFTRLHHRIRAHYHRYLDCNGKTLACMMAVDASFLLEFLQIYSVGNGTALQRVSSRMSHLLDHAGRKSAHHMILRDIVMLENQIPLFCLREILNFQYCTLSSVEVGVVLRKVLVGFVRELYPFTITEDFLHLDEVHRHSHLLELLYNSLTPWSEPSKTNAVGDQNDDVAATSLQRNYCRIELLSASIMNFGARLMQSFKRVLVSRAIKLLVKIPWIIITSLPGLSVLKQSVEHLFFSFENRNFKLDDPGPSRNMDRPPLMEEIAIPSVTELIDAGGKFSPTIGGLTTIQFDAKTGTFYLPTIRLDINTEVVLRNLVAFEVSMGKEHLMLTRYTELMNGIIDTEEDAKALRESGVVLNHMKSDEEVASLWNGMSGCVRLTRAPALDKVIEGVNKYYNSRWRVRLGRFTRQRNLLGFWQFLTLMAGIMLLLLMSLHALCLFHRCGH